MKRTWGGNWTEEKLARLKNYMEFYLNALKHKPFKKIYIDAFAGSGYISYDRVSKDFFGKELNEATRLLKGSPRIVLEVSTSSGVKPFDEYYFVDKDADSLKNLQDAVSDILNKNPNLKVSFIKDDANKWLKKYVKSVGDWRLTRAVVFLDPYGCQVEWSTLEALANTRAIDLFLLFPLGVAVTRLMKKRLEGIDDIPVSIQHTITQLFGTETWKEKLYKERPTLFGGEYVRDSWESVLDFFLGRLKEIFYDAESIPLKNSKNNPIYALIYACSNKKGCELGMKAVRKYLFNPRRVYRLEK